MTPAQLQTLKTELTTDPNGVGYAAMSDSQAADALNGNHPSFWVWRTSVSKDEFLNSTSRTGTTFNWTGNGFITRSTGELAAFRELFNGRGAVNPSQANVRQAFTDIFSGTGNAAANRTHLGVVSRRLATRAERLFATGAGTDDNSAGLLVFAGLVSHSDVADARALP